MLLQAVIGTVFSVLLFFSAQTLAYNEESPTYKWSPRYLYGRKPAPTIYQLGSGIPQRPSRYGVAGYRSLGFSLPSFSSSALDYEGSLASRNPGFVGGSSRIANIKRSACVGMGEKCYIRAGLLGAMMKLTCCPGMSCTLVGHNFSCMPEDNEEILKDDYPIEYIDDEIEADNLK